jgi:chorismate-pyruvate lyase
MSFSFPSTGSMQGTLEPDLPNSNSGGVGSDPEQDLAPLVFFYGLGSVRPRVTFIKPEELPDEEKHLLAHDTDMTPRLRNYHGCEIDLDVHAKARIGNYLVRASVLTKRSDGKPVEFGAIGIHLNLLPESARERVVTGRVPFGAILEEECVVHTSHPRGYFRISVDARLAELLGATPGQVLFGRCNVLRRNDGEALADVVEVLPRGEQAK